MRVVSVNKNFRLMKEVPYEDYRKFIEIHDYVIIENVKIPLIKNHEIKELTPNE